jgi:hypothetical protein
VRQGVEQYAEQAQPGSELALQFFPTLANDGTCAGAGYDTPLIPMAAMPGNEAPISQAVNGATAAPGTTQLEGVLHGGTDFALAYAQAHPELQVNLAILTSFDPPDGCTSSQVVLTSIVATAAHSEPPVRTHVVRLSGGSFGDLSAIALAGGSGSAVAAQNDDEIENALYRAATSCRFALPSGLGPGTTSADLLTVASGSIPFAAVGSASACSGDEYFFSGGQALVLCPSACAKVPPQSPVQVELDVSCP